MGSERPELGAEEPDLGSERPDLRLLGGPTDGRTPQKIALCGIIGHQPLRGRCPKGRKKEGMEGRKAARKERKKEERKEGRKKGR